MIRKETFSTQLLAWYAHHKRDLPWRHTTNPYFIWLSEIILQQTRVKQGLPYYKTFLNQFPTIFDLAAAEEKEVLRIWQGLGYYSRARNMQKTAHTIVKEYGGRFPSTYAELLQLKGIGPYTAAAIASFAFKESVAVVDGNVYRVLSRLYTISTDISIHAAKKEFNLLANSLISESEPDLFNQAMMEFGAIQCTPTSPDCLLCPFQQDCGAYLTGTQHLFPVKSRKVASRKRFFHYIIFMQDGKLALKPRLAKDIWQGLYDFYIIEKDAFLETEELLDLPEFQSLRPHTITHISDTYTHVLTHQKVVAKFWHIHLDATVTLPLEVEWYDLLSIHDLPKPVLIDKYIRALFM